MKLFPSTIHFTGLNTPVRAEASVRDLIVEGEIPSDIQGAFFRAVPDPAHPPMFEDDVALSADGMVAKFMFENGNVDYDIRYVETARYQAEKKARKALFGKYRNPFTDDPSVKGVDRTVSNTTPIWHAGRLFMTKEDGRAYEINPHTLETLGSWDYHGALKSQTMTAHARIDPDTGEMFFFGYEAGGLCSREISYCIADKEGNLVSEQWFEAPYVSAMHDFVITEKYAIFPLFPTTADLDRLKAGGAHWAHQQDLESWVAVMPRYGKVEDIRWFKGRQGVSCFHLINAFDEGDLIHMDLCLSDTNAFPFMREAGGIHCNQSEIGGGLIRWTVDMSKDGDDIVETPLGPPGDMPRLRDRDQGRPYDSAWYLSMNPEGGPPLPGGPVGVAFNALLRIEPKTRRLDMMPLGFGMGLNEPVHIPAKDPAHEGWLMMVVDRQVEDNVFESELWIVDAGNVSAGAVARVLLPLPMKAQVHGWWVSAAQLAQAKHGE
ncbi:carotenoid oxygenase family protein [Emcibacter sp.]|uniref:carotenoid oxygenase family protein n=1 Tax=Emcibacter sp. TaxID=1979954 RepID=UPI002AA7BB08|nr:carotenoid oxygenase family protein [Emcibacter sp.]